MSRITELVFKMNYMQQVFSKLPKPVKAGLVAFGGFVLTQLGGCAKGPYSVPEPLPGSPPPQAVHYEGGVSNDGYVYAPGGNGVPQVRPSDQRYTGELITEVEPDMEAAFNRGYRIAERGLWEGYGTAVVYDNRGMELCYAGKRQTRYGWEDIYRPCRDYNYSSGGVVGIPVYVGGVDVYSHTGDGGVYGEYHYPRGSHGNFLRGGNLWTGSGNSLGVPKKSGGSSFKAIRHKTW